MTAKRFSPFTDEQEANWRKAVAYWDDLPDSWWDQEIGQIPTGAVKPCGCFGAHMSRCFRLTEPLFFGEGVYNYGTFFRKMWAILGLESIDLSLAGAGRLPFMADAWPMRPAVVLRLVYFTKTGAHIPEPGEDI